MAFVMGFFLDALIGMIGFWFLEVNSLLFIYMLLNFFLSGHMFPINMLNAVPLGGGISAGDVVALLPFQYLAYFPAAVFLKKITGAAPAARPGHRNRLDRVLHLPLPLPLQPRTKTLLRLRRLEIHPFTPSPLHPFIL